ncbi:glycosyltransferase family 2 protein [Candidatus Saccharibacteria bacterium]|nr:glycosyltransferase family 2 protein [Candidatus Saccharibacteria bacterium]
MASKEPLISIIVPIYNVAEYLPRCLDSILTQTYSKFEVLLVNDGSTDDSKTICGEYVKKDRRFILINKKNGGVSSARNAGLEKSSGEYITFIDPDDYADEDYLETLLKTLRKFNSDVAACGHITRYGASDTTLSSACGKSFCLSAHDAVEAMLYETYDGLGVSLWAKIFSKALFDGICFPEGSIFEDTAIVFELVGSAHKVGANLISKYNYMMRDDSITNRSFDKSKLDMIDATEYACRSAAKKFPDLKRAAKCRMVYAYLSTLSQASKSAKKPDKKITKKLIRYIRKHGFLILLNKRVKARNKIGVLSSLFGFGFYSFIWRLYSTITGRKV